MPASSCLFNGSQCPRQPRKSELKLKGFQWVKPGLCDAMLIKMRSRLLQPGGRRSQRRLVPGVERTCKGPEAAVRAAWRQFTDVDGQVVQDLGSHGLVYLWGVTGELPLGR